MNFFSFASKSHILTLDLVGPFLEILSPDPPALPPPCTTILWKELSTWLKVFVI